MDKENGKVTLKGIARPNILHLISLSCFLVWVFFVRFSSLLFPGVTEAVYSIAFSGFTVLTLLLGSFFASALYQCLDRPKGFIVFTMAGSTCATVAVILPWILYTNGVGYLFSACVSGILVGIALETAALVAIKEYLSIGFLQAFGIVSASFPMALLAFVLLNWLLPSPWLLSVALFPTISIIALLLKNLDSLPTDLTDMIERRSVSMDWARTVLLFFASLLAAYAVICYPITTQLATVFYGSIIGIVGTAALLSLIVSALLLIYLLAVFLGIIRSVFLHVLSVSALIITIVYNLNDIRGSSLYNTVIAPCAIILVLISLVFFFSTYNKKKENSLLIEIRKCLKIVSSAACLATLIAYVYLVLIFDKISFQDTLFAFTPVVFIVGTIALMIVLKGDLAPVLFSHVRQPEGKNTTTIENQCKSLAENYKLTVRESEVLLLLAQGRNEPYIEETLCISRTTVKTHIKHVYQKAGVSSRQELIDLILKSS